MKVSEHLKSYFTFWKPSIARRITFYFFLIALILLRFLGYHVARKIARPIEDLSRAAADVAKGDLSKSFPVSTKDEFGVLAANFNRKTICSPS